MALELDNFGSSGLSLLLLKILDGLLLSEGSLKKLLVSILGGLLVDQPELPLGSVVV